VYNQYTTVDFLQGQRGLLPRLRPSGRHRLRLDESGELVDDNVATCEPVAYRPGKLPTPTASTTAARIASRTIRARRLDADGFPNGGDVKARRWWWAT
jgi:hypothetical protein